eukprot:TRINITY_DN12465_c0_g1_i1.p1 TRINITY_DN12465_c0_g1~~TRINITY_DN12465_c0_g1_i1.p1  ORF type:complete len:215 (-),score=29.64 TRINITY_DN12465_c0_g1_i1:48-692(-)
MRLVVSLLVLALSVAVCFGAIGVDISQLTSVGSFQCLRNNGFNFAIVRGYESVGRIDPNVASSVANAWAAGFAHVDVYIFPCARCGNPAGQIETLFNYLNGRVRYGTIWLDIEGPGTYWGGDTGANSQFIGEMLSRGRALGATIGVYTSKSQWIPITGGSTVASSAPLWYAHYDGVEGFGDFSAFGGWSRPAMKQFRGNVNSCGTGIDENWYPN